MLLTVKQQQFFDYIQNYINTHKRPPSSKQIQSHFGFASKSSVYKHLQILKTKGFIKIKKKGLRSIALITKKNVDTYSLPILGFLNDEGEIEAFENDQDICYTPPRKLPKNCYALKIQSGNYLEAGLLHHDLVIVEPRSEARTGETILGYLYEERHVIKKYHPKGAYTRLDSFCIQIEPLIVNPEELSIQGVVVGIVRSY